MSSVRVLYFGPLRDLTGVPEEQVAPDQCSASGVLDWVAKNHPEAAGLLPSCAVAVNLEYVQLEDPINPGSEVALIPPVSAG